VQKEERRSEERGAPFSHAFRRRPPPKSRVSAVRYTALDGEKKKHGTISRPPQTVNELTPRAERAKGRGSSTQKEVLAITPRPLLLTCHCGSRDNLGLKTIPDESREGGAVEACSAPSWSARLREFVIAIATPEGRETSSAGGRGAGANPTISHQRHIFQLAR